MILRLIGRWSIIGITGLLFSVHLSAVAQVDQGALLHASPAGSTTNYRFAEPNELTIVVSLLGGVQHPGRYEISRTIDLPNLLSLAGGTIPGADLGDIRIMRTVKNGSAIGRKEFRFSLDDMMKHPEAELTLNQGDFIVVGETSWSTISDVLNVLTTTAVITTAIVSVINITN
jgi:hypothetical protein